MAGKKKAFRILLKIFGSVLSVVMLAAVCITLILAQPQSDKSKTAVSQPLLSASLPVSIQVESDLRILAASFPVPVMSFMSGSGMIFVSGSSSDAAVDGGTGRIVTMNWQTADGDPVILQSIYPASALSLLSGDYQFSNIAGPSLFGSDSVRMENARTLRLHASTDTGLYVVIVPRSLAQKLSALCRSLQLITVSQ